MSTIVTDSLLREPNLLTPNKKPVGNVQIDWNHPLTNGLVGCWIFQAGRLGIDLTGNNNGTNTDQSSLHETTDQYGMAVENVTNNTTARLDLGSITADNPLSNGNARGISLYTFSNIGDAASQLSSYPRWIDKSSGSPATAGWAFYPDLQGDKLTFAMNGLSIAMGANTLDPYLDKYTGCGVSVSPSSLADTISFFLNGENKLTKSTGKGFVSTTTNACLLNWNHATDRQYVKPVHCIYVWDRFLSDIEHKEIHADRYQFLIPA